MILVQTLSWAQTQQSRPAAGFDPVPEPAVQAILAAFDRYQVVAMPEAHGMKDLDDFILALVRDPRFWDKVDDIVVEGGNSRQQDLLDRYIAGEDIPIAEARNVWRNGLLGSNVFFEQLLALVRAINQKLPPEKRLRVVAGEPPVDWNQIKTKEDLPELITGSLDGMPRDDGIAAIMAREVLSKNREALMLFGTFHLFHGFDMGAVGKYEQKYPNVTFVISELGSFDTDRPDWTSSPFASWQAPSLALSKGTWLGALELMRFFPVGAIGPECTVSEMFSWPMERLVDAFLYLGPQDLRLRGQRAAYLALDVEYVAEWQRRGALMAAPGTPDRTAEEINRSIVNSGQNLLFVARKQPDLNAMVQDCLDRKSVP
jgi:hypothetical protein